MTDIHLYNTRTRKKELFKPLREGDVRMYVCGPTVYDRAHIGNARPVVVFDVLYRLLRHVYGAGAVTYARNFTDVDDKINARAAETGRSIRDITDETIGWFMDDMGALGALVPDAQPRATEYIPEMVAMIEALIAPDDKGVRHAYEAEGHVLFDVPSFPDYGKLSRRPLDEMQAGARVEVATYKRDPMDFVLWKPSTDDLPGWDSPWGRGRPGWHIECSAMAKALLGETFDIHGGGIDLAFPHHENEVAQSCCANHTEVMAKVWMHNGFLQVEGEKMAKSLGNFFTVKDLLDKGVPGEVIRWLLLKAHYRQPLDWTEKGLAAAKRELASFYEFPEDMGGEDERIAEPVLLALADDLNVPKAIAELHEMRRSMNFHDLSPTMRALGFYGAWVLPSEPELSYSTMIHAMASDLDDARNNKDYKYADAIREKLIRAGIEVRTTKQGTDWKFTPDFDAAKLEEIGDV
ncbi:MAG: cysteine--tRNA ligase [Proteobacteria bacterium]|nr:cysteine--tRNA ligase [Pseudomonadota bacterium]